ncbi:MAG TPA: sigma-70 family RNA polymerase sigma factor [Nitrospiria bacterium]|nr:sigma-70 family RNA polymerase sigma factor [Nitrospiria bacterium]
MDDRVSELDDESLLRRIQEGDHGAFASLVHRHAKRFHAVAYRIVHDRDDAEDLVQAAFLKLWERPDLWDQRKQTKFTTWFYTVVTNLGLDHAKRKRPIPLSDEIELPDGGPNQDDLLDGKQRRAAVDRLVRQLPERQQLALNLCFYEDLSNQEAADIMGINLKALQSLIMRAKTTLKERLKDAPVKVTNGDER